jgi:hypothetical protein
MELITEINKMRNFMGLTPVNENHLLSEGVPPGLSTIIDDVIKSGKVGAKSSIDTVTRTALNKFLKSGSMEAFLKDDKNSYHLIKWIKGTDGTSFRNALKVAIKNEPDKVTRMSYNAYLKNFDELAQKEIPIFLDIPKPKTNTTKKPVTTTKTNTGGKTNTKIIADTNKIIDDIVKNVDNITPENTGDYIRQFLNQETTKGTIKLGKASIDDVVRDINVILNPRGKIKDLSSIFQGRTIAEQRRIANKVIQDLENSIPPEIKSKPFYQRASEGLKNYGQSGEGWTLKGFINSTLKWYAVVGIVNFIYLANANETFNWDIIKKSLLWPKTWVNAFMSGSSNGTTPDNGTTPENGATPDNGGENKVDWSKYK